MELARLAFLFTSTSNASRAAARYGATSGLTSEGVPRYQDCEGIREAANRSAVLSEFEGINITYDRGVKPDGTQIPIPGIDPSPSSNNCPFEDLDVRNGDRIIVQVSTSYEPIIGIVPLDPLDIVSSSARTFIVSIPIMGSAVPTGFFAETSTPSKVPTATAMEYTSTLPVVNTPTRPPSNFTPAITTSTRVPPPTLTLAPSNTPAPTLPPTITPTFINCSGFTGVSHGPLLFEGRAMEMTINNNTNHVLSSLQVYVEWNHDTGHRQGNDRTLRLMEVELNGQTWKGEIHAPSTYVGNFRPSIPMGESTIRFLFHQDYQLADGTERIIITLDTPGCEKYPIDSRR
jgi:hypothetical protein